MTRGLLLVALLTLATLSAACQVALSGVLHECNVYPEDHLVHCVPILPQGNFTPAPRP